MLPFSERVKVSLSLRMRPGSFLKHLYSQYKTGNM